MKTVAARLISERNKMPWNRDPEILTEAADEIDKLKGIIKDNAIMHVREVNKLINEIKSLKKVEDSLFGNEEN